MLCFRTDAKTKLRASFLVGTTILYVYERTILIYSHNKLEILRNKQRIRNILDTQIQLKCSIQASDIDSITLLIFIYYKFVN